LAEGGFEYALVGGVAVIVNGHNRYTVDVDALVWDLDVRLDELLSLLKARDIVPVTGEQPQLARRNRLIHLIWQGRTYVDVMLGFLPLERDILDHAKTMDLREGLPAKIASPEDLVIMKLTASRAKDIQDVIALKELYPDLDRDRIRAIVTDYAEALERQDILDNLRMWFR
jgi:hypothetical protein